MSAIKQLREWFNGDKRPERSAWITGDTVETRAILELADRLDRLEEKQPTATESPPKPFRITGPGRYKTRDGRDAVVECHDGSEDNDWPWQGTFCGNRESWNANGSLLSIVEKKPKDIVAGPLADEPQQEQEMAGLMAEMLHVLKGVRPLVLRGTTETLTEEDAIRTTWLGHLDAAITKASAIVKLEPKRETRKVWLAMREDGHTTHYTTEEARQAHYPRQGEIIAIVEQEITFTHGQGLDAAQ